MGDMSSIEAEKPLLGSILGDNSLYDEISQVVSADDFSSERHRLIFIESGRLRNNGSVIDTITLSDSLSARRLLEPAGGISYLVELMDWAFNSGWDHYARIIKRKALERKILAATEEIQRAVKGATPDDDILEYALSRFFALEMCVRKQKGGLVQSKAITAPYFSRKQLVARGEIVDNRISTGFSELDDMLLGGLSPKDLILVAARPSMGKSSLGSAFAEHAALVLGKPVAMFSLEMGTADCYDRIFSSRSGIPLRKIKLPKELKQTEWATLAETSMKVHQSPLYIDETSQITPADIKAKLRRLLKDLGEDLGLVVVDYIQIMKPNGSHGIREREISEITSSLKAIAKEFSIPIVALSQLNRSVESRPDKRPMMSDLRESGAIEQDADVVLFIYRDDYYNKTSDSRGKAEIIVAKNRNGGTGTVVLDWIPEQTKFKNPRAISPQHQS